jgi:hypothetical protein
MTFVCSLAQRFLFGVRLRPISAWPTGLIRSVRSKPMSTFDFFRRIETEWYSAMCRATARRLSGLPRQPFAAADCDSDLSRRHEARALAARVSRFPIKPAGARRRAIGISPGRFVISAPSATAPRTTGARRSAALDERSVAQLGDRLLQLRLRVHHDRSVPGHRLLDRFAGDQ